MDSIRSRARELLTEDHPFLATRLLQSLRDKFGDSEFGYRVQALFAHVLVRLGAGVQEINAQGHPDIKASWRSNTLLVQVKSLLHRSPEHKFEITEDDLRGITPASRTYVGYLALLDCAAPMEWIVVDYDRIRRHLFRPVHTVTLKADSDTQFSRDCTREFVRLIVDSGDRLFDLRYALMCERAIKGSAL